MRKIPELLCLLMTAISDVLELVHCVRLFSAWWEDNTFLVSCLALDTNDGVGGGCPSSVDPQIFGGGGRRRIWFSIFDTRMTPR